MSRDVSGFVTNPLGGKARSKSNRIGIPSVNLPKSGGAIKSIDEKFSVNAVNGTAAFALPFPFSTGRNGVTPELSLSYNSGEGNGIFGAGWAMGLSCIVWRTDKKLPEYRDEQDSDTFLLYGGEDLVPALTPDSSGAWKKVFSESPACA